VAKHLDSYNETTDLYLEILRKAQEVEDRKLIQIIRSRLKEVRAPSTDTRDGCALILFPKLPLSVQPAVHADLWPRFELKHIAAILSAYLLLITTL
jgi:hypothetical protein